MSNDNDDLPKGTKSLLHFGAVPDDSAKNDAAFAAFLASEYSAVFVPQGKFMTAREIAVTSQPDKRIYGAGKDLTILAKEPENETSNIVCNEPGLWISDLTIKGPYIPGGFKGTGLSKAGVLFSPKGSQAVVAAAGMAVVPGGTVRSTGAYIYEYKNGTSQPIILSGKTADSLEASGLTQVHPIVSGLRVERVGFDNHTSSGLGLSNGASDIVVSGCRFQFVRKMAMHAFKGVERLHVSDCEFFDNGSILQGDDATKSDVESRARSLKNFTFDGITAKRNGGPAVGAGEAMIGASGMDGFSLTNSFIEDTSTHIKDPECFHFTMLFNAGQAQFSISKNIHVDKCIFDGTRLNHLRFVGVQGASVRRTTFRNAYNRAHVPVAGTASYIRLESAMDTSFKPYKPVIGCSDIEWSDCVFETNKDGGGVRSAVGIVDVLGESIKQGTGNVFGDNVLPFEDKVGIMSEVGPVAF